MSNYSDRSIKMRATIVSAAAISLQAKLTQPFRTAFGQHDILDNVLFSVELDNGISGYGEAGVAVHITGETVEETLGHLNQIAQELAGRDFSTCVDISNSSREKLAKNKAALAALEMALLDALTRSQKIPFWKFFGSKPKELKTAMTIVLGSAEDAEKSAKNILKRGIRTFKIKIGAGEELDLERTLRIKKVIKNSVIYLDANAKLTAEETIRFLKTLRKFKIEPVLIEQPVAKNDWEGLAKVTREGKLTVVADETVSTLADVKKLIKKRAANAINIKFMKFGLLEALEAARLAKQSNLKLMIGQMMESELATTAAAHFAAGFGGFDFVDLDAPFFIKDKIMTKNFAGKDGTYDLEKIKSGIGTEPVRHTISS